MIRIVYNQMLQGWYIVRGPQQTPISGRFHSQGDAQRHLLQREEQRDEQVNS